MNRQSGSGSRDPTRNGTWPYSSECGLKVILPLSPMVQIRPGVDMQVLNNLPTVDQLVESWGKNLTMNHEKQPGSGQVQNPAQPMKVGSWFDTAVHASNNMQTVNQTAELMESGEKNRGTSELQAGGAPKELEDLQEPEYAPFQDDPLDLPNLPMMLEPPCEVIKRDPGTCKICLKAAGHFTTFCPYLKYVPQGEKIGPAAVKVCLCCHMVNCMGYPAGPEQDWPGRALLKSCTRCFVKGDHWTDMCPEKDKGPHPFDGMFMTRADRFTPRQVSF